MRLPFKKKPGGTHREDARPSAQASDGRFACFFDYIRGKTVYLALSGGGLALVCHIAVLRFLEEQNIEVEKIFGTSAGAVIGGFYAAGVNASQLTEAALNLRDPDEVFGRGSRRMLLRIMTNQIETRFSGSGFRHAAIYDNRRLEAYIEESLVELGNGIPRLGELERSFSAVSFDIGTGTPLDSDSGKKQVFSKEETPDVSLKDAIVASISIPGIFTPKQIGDRYYIDGGTVEHLPVLSAFEHWIKTRKNKRENLVILAVDLGYLGETLREKEKISPLDMILYAFNLRGKQITKYSLLRIHEPNNGCSVVLLKPRCYDINLTDFDKIPGALEKSYRNIRQQLEGDNFLKETEEDIYNVRRLLGISE
jgi:predicted acylesterase/phospholipase RssA